MSTVPIYAAKTETAPCSRVSRRFGDLRGVQWRIDLGILPSSPSASIDDLRRVTANFRRRYAALRRQLLVDPHLLKDGSSSPDLVIDNPLSQNPDSMWGRFFRNAELERMVDQDLTRLYPERGGFFQASGFQAILRRILLLWSLQHPEHGYRQGMHELLAPILYALHVDAQRLLEIRKTHEDHFPDNFNTFSFHESDLSYRFDFKKFSKPTNDIPTNTTCFHESNPQDWVESCTPDEPDLCVPTLIALSDAYGAEGELGIVTSDNFIEHDAYAMFDSLLLGGALAMANFFSHFTTGGPHSGSPPVIEASTALYRLLSTTDPSLHAHLVELGVEPQYFALRWLRVLFGREFSLEDLSSVWDEIFAHSDTKFGGPAEFGILESARGAFVCAFGVSMILHLRSSLLATENATACLKRLLNFPGDVGIEKLLEKAGSLHELALKLDNSFLVPFRAGHGNRGHSLSLDSASPKTPPLSMVANSYWEERWRVLHEDEKEEQAKKGEEVPFRKKGWSERVRLRLSRTESDPTPSKKNERNRIPRPSVRRSLLEDLKRQLGSDEDQDIIGDIQDDNEHPQESVKVSTVEDVIVGRNNSGIGSFEENYSSCKDPLGPTNGNNENESESVSSVGSNSSVEENDPGSCMTNTECFPPPTSDTPSCPSSRNMENDESLEKSRTGALKERKVLSIKFQWLWKFGRNGGEGTFERKSDCVDGKGLNGEGDENNVAVVSSSDEISKGETVDQNVMVSLKNLGQSMLENIQVIESVFQQDNRSHTATLENLSKNGLIGKGQVTAVAALKELRKISNLLSEM